MNTARTASQTAQAATTPVSQGRHARPLIDSLRHQIRKLETVRRADDSQVISTGCPGLDRHLPNHGNGCGLATGTLTEWLAPVSGCGAELLSLLAARQATVNGGALVIVDPLNRFYPPAAAAWGINLENTIVLRGSSSSSLFWAIDQALRSPAVAAVWGKIDQIGERWLRRFQLSAEQSGAMGMFVRPASVQGQPGWSDVQWMVGEDRPETEIRNPETSRPQTSHSRSSDLPKMPEPVRRAYQQSLQGKSGPTFDRLVTLRLLRVRGGNALTHENIAVQIDFTTGKMQTVETYEQSREQSPGNEQHQESKQHHKKGPVHLAAKLAHPAAGSRRQRA